jgi:transposase
MEENQALKGGAKRGHKGHGRKCLDKDEADRVLRVNLPVACPHCGSRLISKGTRKRTVYDAMPLKTEKQLMLLDVKRCPKCKRLFHARAPGVLPKALLGNQLLSIIATQHYIYGNTLGQLERQLGIGYGTLVEGLHGLTRRLKRAVDKLVAEYRTSPVKHADETGWRNDGRSGYAWLYCTPDLSIFRFRNTRSGKVAREVLGTKRLPGTLVVDRYNGYNKAPCHMQYCYAHLSRDVEELEKEFPDNRQVSSFVQALLPQLTAAMTLRKQPLSKRQYKRQASQIATLIKGIINRPASHPGIQHIQNIFREQSKRMYRWALDQGIPAENNRAERELRPLVIARKISFGSQSDAGALTRETLMSIMLTLKKRTKDPTQRLKATLDAIAGNPNADVYRLLFSRDTS